MLTHERIENPPVLKSIQPYTIDFVISYLT